MSAYDHVDELPRQQIWDGVLSRSVHGDNVTLALLELDADAVVPEHSHENEQVGILVRGSVTFTIGDDTRTVDVGGTWCILANVPHSVAVGPDGATIVEVFSPPRADWHAISLEPPEPARLQ